MRVLAITDWARREGGTEAYVSWLREGLTAAGDEVRLVVSSVGSAADGEADYVAYGTERLAAQVFLQIANPSAFARARAAVRDFRPDVALVGVFANHLSPSIFPALRGVPTVVQVGDYKVICPIWSKLRPDDSLCTHRAGWVCCSGSCVSLPLWLRNLPRYALLHSGLRGVDCILACSEQMRAELGRAGITSRHLSWPVPGPGPGYHRRPAREPRFVFCGRLIPEKGAHILLPAFATVRRDLPEAQLRIVGAGSERVRLGSLAGELGLLDAVRFTGWLSPEGVERELAEAWALVVPSLWAEPLGLVALEAVVRGVPVVASETGGLPESVESRVSGLLFPRGDGKALAQQMLEVATRRAFPNLTLSPAIVRRVGQKRSIERHVAAMRQVFFEIAGARADGAGSGAGPDRHPQD